MERHASTEGGKGEVHRTIRKEESRIISGKMDEATGIRCRDNKQRKETKNGKSNDNGRHCVLIGTCGELLLPHDAGMRKGVYVIRNMQEIKQGSISRDDCSAGAVRRNHEDGGTDAQEREQEDQQAVVEDSTGCL